MPVFKKAPAPTPRLADDIYEQILSAILNGNIVPGERIVQETIAKEINVSRTPVREALLKLEHQGIIEAIGRRGFSIRKFTEAEVNELYVAREAVEGYSARSVANNNDPDQLAQIRIAIEQESSVTPADVRAYFEVNRNIHRTIVAQVENPILLEVFDSVWNRGISLPLFALIHSDSHEPGPAEKHDQLLVALASGDPNLAYKTMIEHIRHGLDAQLQHL